MAKKANNPAIKIELTPEQREQVRRTKQTTESRVDLHPEELEERVAPKVDVASPKL